MSMIQNAYDIVYDSALGQRLQQADMADRECISWSLDPTEGMGEEASQAYERKIIAKLRSGKRLTAQELSYLRVHNPTMYEIAVRVERARQALREQLRNCRSKEEVQQKIAGAMEITQAMEKAGDPAAGYTAAMIQQEAKSVRESSQYARLPQTTEEKGRKRMKTDGSDLFAAADQEDLQADVHYAAQTLYRQSRYQCSLIDRLAVSL